MSGPIRGTTQRGRMMAPRGRSSAGASLPTFHLLDTEGGDLSGIDNLSPSLTIAGVTETPVFRYKGGDADGTDWDAWGYGETLTAQGSGGSFNDGSPYLGANDDSVNPDGTRYWQGAATVSPGANDFVMEALFRFSGVVNERYLSTKSGPTNQGVDLYTSGIVLRSNNFGAGGNALVQSGTLVVGGWYHVMLFYDASGSAQFYVNAAASGSAVVASGVGAITSTANTALAADGAGGNILDAPIAYLAMWKRDAWLDTHLQAAVAQERFQCLCGLWPKRAAGTKPWELYTRASAAHVDKWEGSERKLYLLGAGHPRMAYRKEETSGDDFKGYLAETAATNIITYSEDITDASWIKTRSSVVGDQATAPDGETAADILHEDTTAAANHNIRFETSIGQIDVMYSVFLKAINRTNARLNFYHVGDGAAYAHYDLSAGTVGTTSGLTSAGIVPYGNGWYRCWARDTRSTSGTQLFFIYPAEADNDIVFDGLDQDSLYVWGAMVEYNTDHPTSYIPTSGATASRVADVLYFKGDDGNVANTQKGSMECDVLLPDVDSTVIGYAACLSDGGSFNDKINLFADSTSDRAVHSAIAGGVLEWNVLGSTDIHDGDSRALLAAWKTDSATLSVDGSSEGTPDTSCTPPDDLDRIHLANRESNISQVNGLIRNVRTWPKPKEP